MPGDKLQALIGVISPAGFEKFFRETLDMVEAGYLDAVATLPAAYAIQFRAPDWLWASSPDSRFPSDEGSTLQGSPPPGREI